MTEHPTKKQLDDYCRRVLPPAVFLDVHRHVAMCSTCAEQCSSPEYAARDLTYLREAFLPSVDDTAPYHLSPIEAISYAKGTLNEIDTEIAASHLEGCESCASEVKRASLPGRRFSLPFVNVWNPVRIAAAVLFVVALALFMVWLIRSKPAEQRTQIDVPLSPSPTASVTTPVTEFAVVLQDGRRKVTLDNRGELDGLDDLPVYVQQKLAAALHAGKIQEPSSLAQLESQPSTLLGEPSPGLPFHVLSPLGEVVRTTRPTFRWEELAGAQSYKVVVTDAKLNEVASSPELKTTTWRITKPLLEGGLYSWQVTALKDGVAITSPTLPAPQAKFKILDGETSFLLQQMKSRYVSSDLALGVIYAEAGLLDDAEHHLRKLARNNPRVPAAQKLLQSVQSMRAKRNSSSTARP